MRFSQRLGFKSSFKQLQVDSLDADLRNGIWNVYFQYILRQFGNSHDGYEMKNYLDYLWHRYFKLLIVNRPHNIDEAVGYIHHKFDEFQWFEVYDFIEFHCSMDIYKELNFRPFQYIDKCNEILEQEFSGYRIIEQIVVPISNEIELAEINETFNIGKGFLVSNFKNVNIHFKEALSKLSSKTNPDYRNSIKESISALESFCREQTGENTLGSALKKMERDGLTLNSQMKSAIERIYAYTNNSETGIRHSIIDTPEVPTFYEAKFVLVITSALLNYLICKINRS
jgi:hypothetical protein